MLKKNKNGNCPFGYVEFNGMCVPENQMNRFQFSNEFTSSNGYQPVPPPPPKPPTPPPPPPPPPTPPGPSPSPGPGPGPSPGPEDDTGKFLRQVAEVTGTIVGVGVAGLEAQQRYEAYLDSERIRINQLERDVDDYYRMFQPTTVRGEGEWPPRPRTQLRTRRAALERLEAEDRLVESMESGDPFGVFSRNADPLGRELNLYDGEQPPLTDSMGRLLDDDRFLINTDTEQTLADMTDAEIQAEIRRQVEEAETGGTTTRPQDSDETQFRRPSGQIDAEDAVEKDPFDEAVEKYEAKKLERDAAQRRYNERRGIVDDGPADGDGPPDGEVDIDYGDLDLDLDNMGGEYGDLDLDFGNPVDNVVDDAPAVENPNLSAAAQEQIDKISRGASKKNTTPPTEEEIAEIEKAYKKKSFIPKQDVDEDGTLLKLKEARANQTDAERLADYQARVKAEQEAAAERGAGNAEEGIPDLYDLIGGGETGGNPIPDMTGEFGGVATEVGEIGEIGETSIIGDIAATTGAADITAAAIVGGEVAAGEAAAFIAGAAGANLLVGAALYGLVVGADAIYDSVTTSDKEYSQQRIDELGSHEMDRREVSYKLQELGAVRDVYEKKVNQGYSVSNKSPKAIAQHEADIAMLNAVQTNIDSLNQSFKKDIPVYVVAEDGFDVENLDSDEKATYDRLTERVSDAKEDVSYGGASAKAENQKRLDNRQRKLDTFINARSGSSVASGFVNKPTDEQMAAIVDDYYENGTDAFGNLSSEQLEVLGVTQAISDRREELEIAGGNFIDDFNNELNNNGINKQQDGIGNLETMNQDAEMQEVYDYLAYMDQRNEAYLASIGQTEALPEAEAEPEAVSTVETDNGKRLKPVKTQSQAMPSSGKRYQSGKAQFPVSPDNGKRLQPVKTQSQAMPGPGKSYEQGKIQSQVLPSQAIKLPPGYA